MTRWLLVLGLAACSSPPAMPDVPASHWELFATLPAPRLEPGVTALGDQVVILGGFDTGLEAGLHITTQVDVLDTGTKTFTQLPNAPVAWTHIQLAAIGTTLYLLGGLAGQEFVAHGESFSLDTATPGATWQPLPTMPEPRGSAAVVVAPPRIYLIGGASTTGALASVIFFDIAQNAWCPGPACSPADEIPPLPAPRSHPAAIRRFDGALVVAGGLATLDASSAAGDTYLLQTSEFHAGGMWSIEAPMPSPRGGCAYGLVAGMLVCAGGESDTSARIDTDSYDPINNVWTENEPMPVPRAGTQGAAIGTRLFVPGGAEALRFEPTDTVFAYTAFGI